MSVIVPNIGSQVRVTTVYPNTYAYRGEYDNYVTSSYYGVVVKSIFNDPFYFAVKTGNIEHPVSEFNSKSQHVVKIEYVKGSGTEVSTENKAWKIKSKSKVYLVTRTSGEFKCSCKGFEYRKDCKHVKAASSWSGK